MPFAAFMYGIPKPFLIAAMVMGFVWFWPVGLAILAGLYATGRIGRGCGPGRWYAMANGGNPQSTNPGCNTPWGTGWGRGNGGWSGRQDAPQSTNSAFDDYRTETLRRLEDEHKEFLEYLERLRRARDKAEFDAFMADRRNTPPSAPVNPN